ncbi:MAG: PAS domain S-box protein [Candidatus Omnitrophica bacterium]|nr:PAS domain S-box protein [Candidatus Omnitrophota bacterium]
MIFATNKQINSLIDSLNSISQGGLNEKVELSSGANLSPLVLSVNNLIAAFASKVAFLEQENRKSVAILDNMVEGVLAIDKDTKIISINPATENIFGIKKSEVLGRYLLEVIRNNDIAEIASKVLINGDFISQELSLVWPVQRIFRINASAIIIGESFISGCLIVIHDITEIRKLEAMRRDFVANVSHELKTPLTSIKGFVETLLEGALDDKENSRHFLEIIHEHTIRLDVLINDLLSLAYLESKALALNLVKTNIPALLDKVLEGFNSQVKIKGVNVHNQLPKELFVNADSVKLGQVLVNLVDNAIKFNRAGGTVKIYHQDLDGFIKIVVEDTGLGIPEKDLERIFERFYRVDKARSRELGGTGLGLSIVKHIIEAHGGSVGVESLEGAGSKFWFILSKTNKES